MRFLKSALAVALVCALVAPMGAVGAPAQKQSANAKAMAAATSMKDAKRAAMREQLKSHFAAAKKAGERQRTSVAASAKDAPFTSRVANTWTVRVDPGSKSSVSTKVRSYGAMVTDAAVNGSAIQVKLPTSSQTTVLRKIGAVDGVVRVTPTVRMRAAETNVSDPDVPSQWWLERIGMSNAWDASKGASTTVIAVLDTGIDQAHPDLKDRIDTANDFDFIHNRAYARDDNGHGTHVAGIAVASINGVAGAGVAPDCTILPIKVLDAEGWGTDFDVAQGIVWATDHGADVISMSLGGFEASQEIVDAVEYAQANDIVVVGAAGNNGWRVEYPGALPGVVTVGASTIYEKVAGFSAGGPELDLVAPGASILSTRRGGGMEVHDGTSMATPMVAAAAALVRVQNPGWDAEQVMQRLYDTAVDRGRTGKDIEWGYGRLNVAAALGEPGGEGTEPSVLSDDDIPGVSLPSDVTTGTLDEYLDRWDVYRVHLEANETFSSKLTSAKGTRFEQVLYSPDAESVYSDEPGSWSDGDTLADNGIRYTAPRAGDFYLLVGSYYGSGAYTITSSVTTGTPSIDRFPGVTLPASPAKGTYTYKDDQDYYTVHLEKGERLALRVSGATGPYSDSEIECTLYDAGSWSAWDRPVAEAWWVNWMSYGVADSELFGMDGFSYVAPETGDYYLNVWGSGEVYDPRTDRSLPAPYRLDWEIVTPGADDDVPGIELTSAETSGTLDYPFDETDVYRVHASEGQRLNVTVETKDKLDIDLGIFGPGSTSVYRDYWVAGSATGNAHESVSFTVPEDGDYYIHAVAWAGSGTYTLRWSVLDSGDFAVAASVDTTKPAYGKPSVFNATVTDPGDGNAPVADQAVHLQRFVNEPEWGEFGWSTVDVGSTDASGNAVLNGRSSEAATWRVVTMDGWDIDTVTAHIDTKPRVQITRPSPSTRTMRTGRWYLWRGTMRPVHDSSGRDVKLRFFKLVQGKWTLHKEVGARNYNPYGDPDSGLEVAFDSNGRLITPYTSYRAYFKFPSKGKWRVDAYHVEDAEHLKTFASSYYVNVR